MPQVLDDVTSRHANKPYALQRSIICMHVIPHKTNMNKQWKSWFSIRSGSQNLKELECCPLGHTGRAEAWADF